MHSIFKATLTASILLTSLFVAQSKAHAEWFTFSGLECVDARDTTPDIYYSDGAYNNSKTQQDVFHCPITRPNTANTSPFTVYVKVRDNHPTQNFRCRVKRCANNGSSCVNSAYRSSTGEGLRAIFLGSMSITSWGNAQIECQVPRKHGDWNRSGILKYSIND